MQRTPFPFIEVPENSMHVFGERIPDTRIYEKEGSEEEAGEWFEAISAVAGSTVSPGGGSMFAPVSRPAVHKRIKEGNLSAFYFYVTSTRKGLFGKQRKTRETPLVFIPTSELKAWGNELETRMLRLGKVSSQELADAKPDWPEEFWIEHAKGKRALIYDVLSRLETFRKHVESKKAQFAMLVCQDHGDFEIFEEVYPKSEEAQKSDFIDLLATQHTILEVVKGGRTLSFSETVECKKEAINLLGPISRANALESESAIANELKEESE